MNNTQRIARVLSQIFQRTNTVLSRTAARNVRQPMQICAVPFSSKRSYIRHRDRPKPEEHMFCFQCEQTKNKKGCSIIGVCGKTPEVAHIQDVLVYAIQGLSAYIVRAKEEGCTVGDHATFIGSALFATLTNVNFDPTRFTPYIETTLKLRDKYRALYEDACEKKGKEPDAVLNTGAPAYQLSHDTIHDINKCQEEGEKLNMVLNDRLLYGEDLSGVRHMIIYGMKGMSAYAKHAEKLGQIDKEVNDFIVDALSFLCSGPIEDRNDLEKTLGLALQVGRINLKVMEMLDRGHRDMLGVPKPNQISTLPKPGKSILVSGHDMIDLKKLLEATKDTDVNVYTHGEMLPAHGYPELSKYPNLAGHFGGAWQLQKIDFAAFPGPVVVTTNCLIEPLRSYKERLFTLNETGWPGVTHLDFGRKTDLDIVIKRAKQEQGFVPGKKYMDNSILNVGFGREVLLDNAEAVLNAAQTGKLRRIFLIGGCDGSENKRNYYTTLADSLPKDTLILTLGCAKYRFARHDFGLLGDTGIPRLLDMGQCNDSYGAIVVAKALADALKTDVNSLPLSLAISWFEQKAVAVLLTLLHLGIKNIRLGPNLPAFITPKVLDILVKNYNIQGIDAKHAVDDMNLMLSESRADAAQQ